MPKNTGFQVYNRSVDVISDLKLDEIDVEILLDYVYFFKGAAFDKDTRVIVINTPILNYQEDKIFKGRLYKIRIYGEPIRRLKDRGAEDEIRF